MITARGIHKSFGKLHVLKGIDFDASTGEVISIVGQSGAGKTTLLQILGTLMTADSGKISISGNEISTLKGAQLSHFRNRYIGFVFQFHHLLPEFTALENVCIPAFIAGTAKKKAIEKAEELLNFLNLNNRMHHKPSELSGGEQQRVAVARALINNPAVVFADEPSGNLDTKNKLELHELFFSLRNKFQQTFIIVTHDTELADMSDRKITIQDGIIV